MPSADAPPSGRRPALLRLTVLTAAVAGAHLLVLAGMPDWVGWVAAAQGSPSEPTPWQMRTLASTAVATPRAAATVATPQRAPARTVEPAPSPSAEPAPATAAAADSTAVDTAAAPASALPAEALAPVPAQATQPDTAAAPQPASSAPQDEQLAKLTAPPAAAAKAQAATHPAEPVVLPPAVRLLYAGKGEEKGYMKYNASAELAWLPEGARYQAKLDITFLALRLRTWTSKGALTEAGLQPLRFGDKPRGAEVAAHFQRDKGIISFSANSPDVPLQPGAQDKLSALLQLSALVAGAPQRYGAGTQIGFQAADAYRAELWTFTVGGLEALDLPGGGLSGLKLTKQPTQEFDQRIEVWLAPEQHYLPVRLRITEPNNTFVDLLWQKTLKPD